MDLIALAEKLAPFVRDALLDVLPWPARFILRLAWPLVTRVVLEVLSGLGKRDPHLMAEAFEAVRYGDRSRFHPAVMKALESAPKPPEFPLQP
jgi:hypothetical protein